MNTNPLSPSHYTSLDYWRQDHQPMVDTRFNSPPLPPCKCHELVGISCTCCLLNPLIKSPAMTRPLNPILPRKQHPMPQKLNLQQQQNVLKEDLKVVSPLLIWQQHDLLRPRSFSTSAATHLHQSSNFSSLLTPPVFGSCSLFQPLPNPLSSGILNDAGPLSTGLMSDTTGPLACGLLNDMGPLSCGLLHDVGPLSTGLISDTGPLSGPLLTGLLNDVQSTSVGPLSTVLQTDTGPLSGGLIPNVQSGPLHSSQLIHGIQSGPLASSNLLHNVHSISSSTTTTLPQGNPHKNTLPTVSQDPTQHHVLQMTSTVFDQSVSPLIPNPLASPCQLNMLPTPAMDFVKHVPFSTQWAPTPDTTPDPFTWMHNPNTLFQPSPVYLDMLVPTPPQVQLPAAISTPPLSLSPPITPPQVLSMDEVLPPATMSSSTSKRKRAVSCINPLQQYKAVNEPQLKPESSGSNKSKGSSNKKRVKHVVLSDHKPYTCSHAGCEMKFARNHDLKRHELIHTCLKTFECKECGRAFGRRDALSRHMSAPGNRCKAMVSTYKKRVKSASEEDEPVLNLISQKPGCSTGMDSRCTALLLSSEEEEEDDDSD